MPSIISGGKGLEKALRDMAKRVSNPGTLRVGFLEGATEADGTSIAFVAATNNFGAPGKGIPPRPFFSNMVKTESPHWGDDIAAFLKANDFDANKTLKQMGLVLEGQLKVAILETDAPPNSPVTNLLKQRFPMGGQTFDDVLQARADVASGTDAPAGKPLVQSSGMLNAVASEVV